MMSGACPPPAPSVWKAWMVRPSNAAMVSSTKPLSFSVSVWIMTWTSKRSATSSAQRMLAGVVPQSSCSFRQLAPARSISSRAAGWEALPLPEKDRLTGRPSAACSMRARCQGPGVQVVAEVPVAGPVPPPTRVVIPAASASSICWGQMKWMWLSMPPAVRILPSPAMISVPGPMTMSTLGWMSGLPALPMAWMRPCRMATSALTMPQWSRIRALVMTVSTAPSAWEAWDWPMPSRMTLPPPNFTSSP